MKRTRPFRRWSVCGIARSVLIVLPMLLVGCGGEEMPAAASAPAASGGAATAAGAEGEVIVFAASSLTDAFKEAMAAFRERNPKAKVTFNFASSSALSTQINEGAPADVFASADAAQMKVVTDAGNATGAVLFATNLPVVVAPKSSTTVQSFADLAKAGVKLVLAGPEVPIGRYAREIFANASKPSGGIGADFAEKALANLKSNEANVRAVLTKVQVGEADAGVVYNTDAAIASADVTVVNVPAAYNVIARYPIATLKGGKNSAAARAWVNFILSSDGQAVMSKFGFGKP